MITFLASPVFKFPFKAFDTTSFSPVYLCGKDNRNMRIPQVDLASTSYRGKSDGNFESFYCGPGIVCCQLALAQDIQAGPTPSTDCTFQEIILASGKVNANR